MLSVLWACLTSIRMTLSEISPKVSAAMLFLQTAVVKIVLKPP